MHPGESSYRSSTETPHAEPIAQAVLIGMNPHEDPVAHARVSDVRFDAIDLHEEVSRLLVARSPDYHTGKSVENS